MIFLCLVLNKAQKKVAWITKNVLNDTSKHQETLGKRGRQPRYRNTAVPTACLVEAGCADGQGVSPVADEKKVSLQTKIIETQMCVS